MLMFLPIYLNRVYLGVAPITLLLRGVRIQYSRNTIGRKSANSMELKSINLCSVFFEVQI